MDLDKLLAMQELCINDSPAPCMAKCPIHVDIKGFIKQMQDGNFERAYEIIERRLPMPRILSRVCEHPCENNCIRKDIGGSVSIKELAKAAVEYGRGMKGKKLLIPSKNKTVAIIGGGVGGLTCAIDLQNKGYKAVVYEKDEQIGGRLRQMLGEQIPQEIFEEEIECIQESGIKIKTNTMIMNSDMDVLKREYDAIYIATGRWEGISQIDNLTLATEIPGIFYGYNKNIENKSIILSVSTGRIAAISIDRYIKKASITAQRQNEGPYDTDLEVDIEGVTYEPRITTSNMFSKGEAVREAQRCILCECGKCYKACPHLRYEKLYPKAYIRTINQNERVIMGDRYANITINSCMVCGLCLSVCPTNLDMGQIIRDTRKSMVEREKMPPSAHDFALKDMEFNTSEYFSLLKHEPLAKGSTYLFFPGCQLCGSFPEYVEKTYSYLIENLEGVGLYLNCCGAPAEWAGREDLFRASIDRISTDWQSMRNPTFILACSTCYYMFKKYLPKIRLITLWDVFNEKGLPTVEHKMEKRKLLVHDSCTARDYPNIYDGIRDIMKMLGHEIIEPKYTKEHTQCCGYGGLSYYANRKFSNFATDERIQEKENYLAYCAMCRDLFVSRGRNTFHVLDLIFGKCTNELSSKKGPTLSERRDNRLKLKISILEKFWGEKMDLKEEHSHLDLVVDEKTKEILEDRLILEADIKKAIGLSEESRNVFINAENNHRLAFRRILNVTYWVEYIKLGDSYKIITAYSHRMDVLGE